MPACQEIPDLVKKLTVIAMTLTSLFLFWQPESENIHRYQASLLLHHEEMDNEYGMHGEIQQRPTTTHRIRNSYDMRTGIPTLIPVSVNGNWRRKDRRAEPAIRQRTPLDDWQPTVRALQPQCRHDNPREGRGKLRSVKQLAALEDEVKLNSPPE